MKPETEEWLKKAEEDLNAAAYNFKGKLLDPAGFFCHQAAEKALKAVHIDMFGELWKTHDLAKLARKLKAPERIVEICSVLNPAYIATRYPEAGSFSKDDVKELLDSARRCWNGQTKP